MKKTKKILLLPLYFLCLCIFYFNHRLFMKLFNSYLIAKGLNLHGTPRYIGVHVKFDNPSLIEIGDKTTISDECHLLTHDYSITNAFRACGKIISKDIAIVRGIKIGNNCFIGKKSIIMPNTSIGDNCIIGAGSVVRGEIPNNSLVIGNPAQIIGNVFELAKKWEKLNPDLIRQDK